MSDVEKLLSEDGARWRASQPPPPEPDLDRLAAARRRGARWQPIVGGRGSRWQPLAAAAAVVAVVAAGVVVASLRDSTGGNREDGPVASDRDDMIVRDGDMVRGQGEVVALPGRPVQLCPPRPVARADVAGPPEPPPPCEIAVTLEGLDLDRISEREERDGAVWGLALVEGVYRAGTVTVTRQDAPIAPPRDDVTAPDEVPCPEPPGGWPRQPRGGLEPELTRLRQVIEAHSGVLSDVYVRYPYGWHLQDESNRKGTEVYVVGTTGDVAEAEAMLRAVFPAEHLCVTRVTWSKDAMAAAEEQLRSEAAKQAGISDVRPETLTDRVVAHLVVLDETASTFLAGVAEGRVVADPLLHRVG
jgi:hypothetical protein